MTVWVPYGQLDLEFDTYVMTHVFARQLHLKSDGLTQVRAAFKLDLFTPINRLESYQFLRKFLSIISLIVASKRRPVLQSYHERVHGETRKLLHNLRNVAQGCA